MVSVATDSREPPEGGGGPAGGEPVGLVALQPHLGAVLQQLPEDVPDPEGTQTLIHLRLVLSQDAEKLPFEWTPVRFLLTYLLMLILIK